MIAANIQNKAEYYGIHPELDKALDCLTPEFLENVTVSALENLRPVETAANVGKLIRGDSWYYGRRSPRTHRHNCPRRSPGGGG